MKAGTLSQAVAQAGIEKAEQQLHTIVRVHPEKEEQQTATCARGT